MRYGRLNTLRWLRVAGDTIFVAGAFAFGWFILWLRAGWSIASPGTHLPPGAVPTSTSDD